MEKPLISVIIPVYNVEKYLTECIDSVINQTYKNLEIILVDDGSTDSSGEICDRYETETDNIRVIHQENAGLSEARNKGLEYATGEYITFIDSDDSVSEEMLETLFSAMTETGADVSSCNFTRDSALLNTGSGKVSFYDAKRAMIELFYDREIVASAVGKIYKKSVLVAFEPGRIYEDYLFSVNVFIRSNGVSFVDKALYFYRVNPNSITQVTFTDKNFDILHASNQVETIITQYNRQLLRFAYIRRCHLSTNLYIKCCLSNCLETYGKRLRKEVGAHYCTVLCSALSFKRKMLITLIKFCPRLANNMIRKKYG